MTSTLTPVERNPLAIRAAAALVVTGLVHLFVVFGAPIDEVQEDAIAGLVDAAGLLALVLWARSAVTPNAKVIARVTTDGSIVAGAAAVDRTGSELEPVILDGSTSAVVDVRSELLSKETREGMVDDEPDPAPPGRPVG